MELKVKGIISTQAKEIKRERTTTRATYSLDFLSTVGSCCQSGGFCVVQEDLDCTS